MKLDYAPGACSLSPHIVARELGLPIEIKKVNNKEKTVESGGDYWKINARGYVPALELDNGEILTEGPAIVQYLADQKPESGLAPKAGATRFDWLDKQLAGKEYLRGKTFTVADAYLFVLLNWTKAQQIDLSKWPNLAAFQKRVAARPKVKQAMQAEGLIA